MESPPGEIKIRPFLFLLFLLLIVPESQAKRHHRRRVHHHHRVHREELWKDPVLTCHPNRTATVTTGDFATVAVVGSGAEDRVCFSAARWKSISFKLREDCKVQAKFDREYNFTIVARKFENLFMDEDRLIPMKCSYYFRGEVVGGWKVQVNPDIKTVERDGIIREYEDSQDIDLVDETPTQKSGSEFGLEVEMSSFWEDARTKDMAGENAVDMGGENAVDVTEEGNVRNMVKSEEDMGKEEMIGKQRKEIPDRMVQHRLREVQQVRLLPPKGFVLKKQHVMYAAPVAAAVVFISLFVIVVYIRQLERNRKLRRLDSKRRHVVPRAPTTEDLRGVVSGVVSGVDNAHSDGAVGSPASMATPDQVTPTFDAER